MESTHTNIIYFILRRHHHRRRRFDTVNSFSASIYPPYVLKGMWHFLSLQTFKYTIKSLIEHTLDE